jgi:hypothetical protein
VVEVGNTIIAKGVSYVNTSKVKRYIYALDRLKLAVYCCFMSKLIAELRYSAFCRYSIAIR